MYHVTSLSWMPIPFTSRPLPVFDQVLVYILDMLLDHCKLPLIMMSIRALIEKLFLIYSQDLFFPAELTETKPESGSLMFMYEIDNLFHLMSFTGHRNSSDAVNL